MATVTLNIGGRPFPVACRDGEEARLQSLGRMVAERWPAADRAANGQPERAMLYVALMLADALDEADRRPAVAPAINTDEVLLGLVAEQLELLAHRLEQ